MCKVSRFESGVIGSCFQGSDSVLQSDDNSPQLVSLSPQLLVVPSSKRSLFLFSLGCRRKLCSGRNTRFVCYSYYTTSMLCIPKCTQPVTKTGAGSLLSPSSVVPSSQEDVSEDTEEDSSGHNGPTTSAEGILHILAMIPKVDCR